MASLGVATSAGARDAATERFAGCCKEPDGSYAAVAYDQEQGVLRRIPLPSRGHDIAVRPGSGDCVVFARRPGRDAIVFSIDSKRPPQHFTAAEGRHFFGHGVFSVDGRLLFSTEAAIGEDAGRIGVRDATGRYRSIGEFGSGGIGPHDLALSTDGRTLVVANGGIATDGDRTTLNLADMRPSLAYVDTQHGDVVEALDLPPELKTLSIRHLAVARDNTVVFGCQYEGGDGRHPPLVGFHRRGRPLEFFEIGDVQVRSLRNYVGSVAADRHGDCVVATSPRGGIALMIDVASRRIVGEQLLDDVCGVAERHRGRGFVLTTGAGISAVWQSRPEPCEIVRKDVFAWDNHAVHL